MSKKSEELQVLGKITGFYGVKGWLKLYSYTDPRENIVQYSSLKIKLSRQDKKQRHQSDEWRDIHLDSGKAHGKGVVAHFTGYDTREAAADLIGSELAVHRSDFKAIAKDEYYWTDLINLKVVNLEGIVLGHVSRLMETAANDVLVIKSEQNNTGKKTIDEVLIPFVLGLYIERVNIDAGIIEVDWQADWNEAAD